MTDSRWNGLEIAKLAVFVLAPVLVLVLGIIINNSIKSAERSIDRTIGGDKN
jgi:hypothetical protein